MNSLKQSKTEYDNKTIEIWKLQKGSQMLLDIFKFLIEKDNKYDEMVILKLKMWQKKNLSILKY